MVEFTGSGMFLLDASGKISLAATLDREDTSHYQLTITVSNLQATHNVRDVLLRLVK